MTPTIRIRNSAAALGVVAFLLGAAAPPQPIFHRALDVVQQAVSQPWGHDNDVAASVARAGALLDVSLDSDSHAAVLLLHTHGNPLPELNTTEGGRQLTLDLYAGINLLAHRRMIPEDRALVRAVSVEQQGVDPIFVTRLVLTLAHPCIPRLQCRTGEVILSLTTADRDFSDPISASEYPQMLLNALERREGRIAIEQATLAEFLARRSAVLVSLEGPATASWVKTRTALMKEAEQHADQVRQALSANHRAAEALKASFDSSRAASLLERIEQETAADQASFQELLAKCEAACEALREDRIPDAPQPLEKVAVASAQIPAVEAVDSCRMTMPERTAQTCWALARASEVIGSDFSGPRKQAAEKVAQAVPLEFKAVNISRLELQPTTLQAYAATADSPEESPAAQEDESEVTPEVEEEADLVEAKPAKPEPQTPKPALQAAPLPPVSRDAAPSPEPTGLTTASHLGPSVDPLYQPVTIDFRDMELSSLVALLAQKAQINVIAGADVAVKGTVSAYLQDVPLLQAMETVLRMNELGLVEEEGIYRIVSYETALSARRDSKIVYLQNGQAADIQKTLDSVAQGMPETQQISIASNDATNVIIISGPEKRVAELEELTYQLDVAEPTLATVTEAIKLNYADPAAVIPLIETMLTEEGVGSAEADIRGSHVIVTDLPIVIEQVRELIAQVDTPVRQVSIEAMVIDAVLRDSSETGVTWLLDLVRQRNSAGEVTGVLDNRANTRGEPTGSLQDMSVSSTLGEMGSDSLNAGILTFGVLADGLDLHGAIAAEVANSNAEILANPMVVTTENKEAEIQIVQDYPYQEITQSTQGPAVASTAFKEIGIDLKVTPRVTHSRDIIVDVEAKQSSISGLTSDGIPIEDKRVASTQLRTADNRTIFIGGLRNITDNLDVSKIPVLGDIPVLNFMFRNTSIDKVHTELLIFLTCRVIEDELPELTPEQRVENDKLQDVPRVPNSQRALFHTMTKPGEMRDPMWKWRRTP